MSVQAHWCALGWLLAILSLNVLAINGGVLFAQNRDSPHTSNAARQQYLSFIAANAVEMDAGAPESADAMLEKAFDQTRLPEERARALASTALTINTSEIPLEQLTHMALSDSESELVKEQCVVLAGKALLDADLRGGAERFMYAALRSKKSHTALRTRCLLALALLGRSNNCFLREVATMIADVDTPHGLLDNIAELLFLHVAANRGSIDAVLNAILFAYEQPGVVHGRKLQLLNAVSLLERHAIIAENEDAIIDPQTQNDIVALAEREFVSEANPDSIRVFAATFLYGSSSLAENTIDTAESLVNDETQSERLRDAAARVVRQPR